MLPVRLTTNWVPKTGKNAAVASWEAIQAAEQWGYILLSATDYKLKLRGNTFIPMKKIWGWSASNQAYNSGNLAAIVNGIFCFKQNQVIQANVRLKTRVDKF